MRAIGRARLRSDIDPDDFVQEALTRALASRRSLRDPAKLSPWVGAIARNLAQEWNRAPASLPNDLLADDLLAEVGGTDLTPLARAQQAEEFRHAHDAMDALDPDDRRILHGYYVEDLTCVELRGRLRLSHAAVRMRLHRARTALRRRLRPLLAGVAVAVGLRAGPATGSMLTMKMTAKATLGVVALSAALVGGVAWRMRGPALPAAPGETPHTSAHPATSEPVVTGSHVVVRDGATRERPAGERVTRSVVVDGRGQTPAPRPATGGAASHASAAGSGTAAASASDLSDGVARTPAGLNPDQRRVYEELARILPQKDDLFRRMSEAAEELRRKQDAETDADRGTAAAAGMRALSPLLEELSDLDDQLAELVPGAIVRESREGFEEVSLDMDRVRAAAGGTLPYEPQASPPQIDIRTPPGDDGGAGLRVVIQ